ncbi:MAG TPA: EAL domain-containing protein [Acidimicrobiales bacterium]|nr:EAL domain-containing protein [Acidimicrobiales bacterium]
MADVETRAVHTALADHLNDLVAVFDVDGRCLFLNRTGRRLLRLEPDAPLDLRLGDLPGSADRERFANVVSAVRAGDTWTGSMSMASPITGEFPTRSTICPLTLQSGEPGFGWVAKDTTTDRDVIRSLRQRAFYDPLTGLSHRSLFLDRLDLLLRRVSDDPTPVAVLFVTPDRFKEKINRFDQAVGDALLKAIAGRFPEHLGPDQSVHRWGDEDFVVLCEGVQDEAEALAVAEEVARCFRDPFTVGEHVVFLTASCGVALGVPGTMTTDELIRHADAAGQLAKNTGGGSIRLFDEELRARAMRRAELEDELWGAAERGELVLHYQPEVRLLTNEIVGAEVLVRWRHPRWGLVAPNEFIPIAETSSLIIEIGDWVLREALTQCAALRQRHRDRDALVIAVNISAKQFVAPDFVDKVAAVLADTGARPADVCLEITESVLLDDAEETISRLGQLKALGIHLAIDDFGTGYSSLSYLRRFPVDILKVDQSFVSGLGHDPEDSAIVQAVIQMGKALRMTTLAEGVETAHHLIELRELECDVAQGFHFARPVPLEQYEALLDAGDDWLTSSTG